MVLGLRTAAVATWVVELTAAQHREAARVRHIAELRRSPSRSRCDAQENRRGGRGSVFLVAAPTIPPSSVCGAHRGRPRGGAQRAVYVGLYDAADAIAALPLDGAIDDKQRVRGPRTPRG